MMARPTHYPPALPQDGDEGVSREFYQHEGCAGWVVRWFVQGDPTPYRTKHEALQALARMHERRGQP
jgi:hypothetical protein